MYPHFYLMHILKCRACFCVTVMLIRVVLAVALCLKGAVSCGFGILAFAQDAPSVAAVK